MPFGDELLLGLGPEVVEAGMGGVVLVPEAVAFASRGGALGIVAMASEEGRGLGAELVPKAPELLAEIGADLEMVPEALAAGLVLHEARA